MPGTVNTSLTNACAGYWAVVRVVRLLCKKGDPTVDQLESALLENTV